VSFKIKGYEKQAGDRLVDGDIFLSSL